MKKHIQFIGILHMIMAGFGLLAGIAVLAFMSLILNGEDINVRHFDGSQLDTQIPSWVRSFMYIVPVLMITLSLPGLFAGYGLIKRKPWARILTFIVSGFMVINPPLGTALGVYSFWVLLDDEVKAEFEDPHLADLRSQRAVS